VDDNDEIPPASPVRRNLLLAGGVLTLAAFVVPQLPSSELRDDLTSPADKAVAFIDSLALTQVRNDRLAHTWVRRWDRDVDVLLMTPAPDNLVEDLDDALVTLADLTGLNLARADARVAGRGVFDIYVRTGTEMSEEFGNGLMFCNTHSRGFAGSMRFARIDISEDHPGCLRHELMHALGFTNHWEEPVAHPSMASVLAKHGSPFRSSDYSKWDELAIRTLYDPELPPGTHRSLALGTIRTRVERALESSV
jgi:hypothetical protein